MLPSRSLACSRLNIPSSRSSQRQPRVAPNCAEIVLSISKTSDYMADQAAKACKESMVAPHKVQPPAQAPDLLEDTALPLSGLQEAFAKAYAWQQQKEANAGSGQHPDTPKQPSELHETQPQPGQQGQQQAPVDAG